MRNQSQVFYPTLDQATTLVDRIATRPKDFSYYMSKPEKEAMAELLSSIGVMPEDLLDVSNLADNYAVNAELVSEEDLDELPEDYLFTWKERGVSYYCITW